MIIAGAPQGGRVTEEAFSRRNIAIQANPLAGVQGSLLYPCGSCSVTDPVAGLQGFGMLSV